MKSSLRLRNVKPERLVYILCRQCGVERSAEITDASFNKANDELTVATRAICLCCGRKASDSYNWGTQLFEWELPFHGSCSQTEVDDLTASAI